MADTSPPVIEVGGSPLSAGRCPDEFDALACDLRSTTACAPPLDGRQPLELARLVAALQQPLPRRAVASSVPAV